MILKNVLAECAYQNKKRYNNVFSGLTDFSPQWHWSFVARSYVLAQAYLAAQGLFVFFSDKAA